ncbi:hypothetical protein Xen7305DRAFT_00009020 [Xenococcus sp. PCC 7305]|uniref:hypothetical protein n=1 Tax=Xenococcus sp. PCC 7305 TaxID=102125 RepID=UPI0002ACDD00|nr:hypothetical protein [Xenococcus sp. PCC 7305]ELS01200.1 hypothetical protein Xen7305DRAFT_00009020 [Xenococcus sp. PCC 7305]
MTTAKPKIIKRHPWQTKKGYSKELAEKVSLEEISILTGYYQNGTKEFVTCWEFNLWQRLLILFFGHVYMHSLEDLPIHKLSTDIGHVRQMEKAWSGDEEALKKLASADKDTRREAIKTHFQEENQR